jgi:mono/diheme cytochrome c family protein
MELSLFVTSRALSLQRFGTGLLRFSATISVLFLTFACSKPRSNDPTCLRCHPPHYVKHGTCTTCHRGNDRASRQALAHHHLIPGREASFALVSSPAVERGRCLAEQLACRRCHLLEGRGNRLAGNLDQAGALPSSPLAEAIRHPAWYMPDFRLADAELHDLVTYLLFSGSRVVLDRAKQEVPLVVHFAPGRQEQQDPFSRNCGGCHMILTRKHGGLGQGKVAPNLSGLLGPFYPASYRADKPWTETALKEWLKNPRQSRHYTTMPPIRLTEQEFVLLVKQIEPLDSKGVEP